MSKRVTRYSSGFDYGYKPLSYFNDLDPNTLIVSSILGEERRKDVLERIASGNFDPAVWSEWLTDSKLDDAIRTQIGRVHPRFMGGEYLPEFGQDEIEIVRVVLASVMQDVISVRARRSGKRIIYRVVDEYENHYTLAKRYSAQPLSLKELIGLINHSNQEGDTMATGIVFSILDWHLYADSDQDMSGFIAVSSDFYSELGAYYDWAIDDYLKRFERRKEVERRAANSVSQKPLRPRVRLEKQLPLQRK